MSKMKISLLFLLNILYLPTPYIGEWDENFLVNASQTLAAGENMTQCWICHPNPETPSRYNTYIKAYSILMNP